jgi:hypothetical protein
MLFAIAGASGSDRSANSIANRAMAADTRDRLSREYLRLIGQPLERRAFVQALVMPSLMRLAERTLSPDELNQFRARLQGKRPPPSGGGGKLPPEDRAVFSLSDLTFLGFIRWPAPGTLPGVLLAEYGRMLPGMAARQVKGEWRIHIVDNVQSNPTVYECTLPAAEPSTSVGSAPRLRFLRSNGPLWAGVPKSIPTRTTSCTAIHYDATHGGFWLVWKDGYGNPRNVPSSAFVTIDESTGLRTAYYGPWRNDELTKRTSNFANIDIPAFLRSVNGNRRQVRFGSQDSQNATATFGCNFIACDVDSWDPYTRPADKPRITTISTLRHLQHLIDSPQKLSIPYRRCNWPGGARPRQAHGASYICAYDEPWVAGVGGPNPFKGRDTFSTSTHLTFPTWLGSPEAAASAEANRLQGLIIIDLPDMQGALFNAVLGGNEPGYSAPGDPMGLVHRFYADPGHASTRNDGISYAQMQKWNYFDYMCCHGQGVPYQPGDDLSAPTGSNWDGTGPACHRYVPVSFVYDLMDFARVAIRQRGYTPSSLTPTDNERFIRITASNPNGIVPDALMKEARRITTYGYMRGGFVDPSSRRLYVRLMRHNGAESVLAVFSIAPADKRKKP